MILPVSRSRQMTLKVCLRSAPMLSGWLNSLSPSMPCFTALAPVTGSPSMAVVKNTLLPQTIGDERARPSIAVFHFMFLVGLHSDGRFFSFEMPEPSGPRHCGQFPADTFAARRLRLAKLSETPTIRANAIRRDNFTAVVPLLFVCSVVLLIDLTCCYPQAFLQMHTDVRRCARSPDRPRARASPS